MKLTAADLIERGFDPDTGRRATVPADPASRAGRDGRGRVATPQDSQNASSAAKAVNSAPGVRTGPCGDGGEARQPRRRNKRPEEALQTAIVAYCRPKLVPGARLFATNGELPGGAEQVKRASRRKRMGYVRGTPDLCARRPNFLLWLECKHAYEQPTDEQLQWASWALDECGDGYAVVNSVEEAASVLKIWGMLA